MVNHDSPNAAHLTMHVAADSASIALQEQELKSSYDLEAILKRHAGEAWKHKLAPVMQVPDNAQLNFESSSLLA